ncbi:hypothetical protein H8B09_07110 [Paenibacillus sp. PR3]|uniref:Phage protein n=1 Tax=Paenibacillus terricola TaxID=2763503 RepID=A0ABR8MRA1_9BACL|nr:hypothetical protein [Paenibacillus terricola]MBD3918519.1 hypothetical protein [Paenibacillus terricola]
MYKLMTIDDKSVQVSFSVYYDTEVGEFLFLKVMCDIYMPGNEVVPIAIEKVLMKKIEEGFKKRPELYDLLTKQQVKGKTYYVIPAHMRYQLDWLEGNKKKASFEKMDPSKQEELDKAEVESAKQQSAPSPAPESTPTPQERIITDIRRKFLVSKGFQLNAATNNWVGGGIRFPDALIDKPATDVEFEQNMNRLIAADSRGGYKKK